MSAILTRVFPHVLLPLLVLGPGRLSASAPVEVVEIPASEAHAAASMDQRLRPLTLGEQYSLTRIGAIHEGPTEDFPLAEGTPGTVFACRDLIDNATGGADRTALVVEVSRKKAYLMIDGVMVLETPVSVVGKGDSVPLGWLPVSGRSRGSALSSTEDVKPSYFLRLGTTPFGLHSDDIRRFSAASGCIRFPRPAMKTVFDLIEDGTMVYVCASWLGPVRLSPTPTPTPATVTSVPVIPPKRPLPVTIEVPSSVQEASLEPEPSPVPPPPPALPTPESIAIATPTEVAKPGPAMVAPPAGEAEPEDFPVVSAPPVRKRPASRSHPEPEEPLPPFEWESAPRPVEEFAAPVAKENGSPQMVRIRDLLGGFAENPAAMIKPLIPVTGRNVHKPAASKTRETPEVVRLRSLIKGK
ncbi:MAG: L,D-transpeptidase [Verrucomicrobia bacterium]|nr:L,D-transpeptidase [Verrucomicrobiota bacterium]